MNIRFSDYIDDIKGVLLVCFSAALFFTLILAAFGMGTARLALLWTCFCIEYHYINILAACQYMVNAAEANVVCPSVTTKDPLGFLSQEIFLSKDFFGSVTSACF